jgi:hypothetical protein
MSRSNCCRQGFWNTLNQLEHSPPPYARRTGLILALFSGGLAFYEFAEFHPPASLVEAFLQRP